MVDVAVSMRDLSFTYSGASEPTLRSVTFDIARGSRIVLVGENGVGKSTLISIIAGKHMCPPGSVTVLGEDAFRCSGLAERIALVTAQWGSSISSLHSVSAGKLLRSACGGDLSRRARLVLKILGVDEAWTMGALSEGQLRRVQLAVKLSQPRDVLLLDEATTDLDLIVRRNLLMLLFEESRRRNVTIDHAREGDVGSLYGTVREWMSQSLDPERQRKIQSDPSQVCTVGPSRASCTQAVCVSALTFAYVPAGRRALVCSNLEIPCGARCLLTGMNGAGKSTLMSILASLHLVPEGACSVLGRAAFHDLTLHDDTVLLSQEWRRMLRDVGVGGNLTFRDLACSIVPAVCGERWDEGLVRRRLEHLVQCLEVDVNWKANAVSDGQLRRMQLALKLMAPRDLVLLDEASVDLDVLARQALLRFLEAESTCRGATIIYCTHILDGLDGWATHHVHMHNGRVMDSGGVPVPMPAGAEIDVKEGSELYRLVQALLLRDLAHRNQSGEGGTQMDVVTAADKVTYLPPLWGARVNTFGGAYGSAKWQDNMEDDSDINADVVDMSAISECVEEDAAAQREKEELEMKRKAEDEARRQEEEGETEREREAAAASVDPINHETEAKRAALRGALAVAIRSLAASVAKLSEAVETGDVSSLQSVREETGRLWVGLGPALDMLESTLPKPQSETYSDLPWGFGSGRRSNTLPPDELVRQQKILPQ